MDNFWNVSSSPHVRGKQSTGSIMYQVAAALVPTTAFGVYHFGLHALYIVLISVVSAMIWEFLFQKIAHQKVTALDGSALVTGLLLGLNLPPTVPLWIPVLGSAFAIIFVKQFFGGIGQNFMNPALGARCFLLISFTEIMSNYQVDGVSGATPLALLAQGEKVSLRRLFLGFTGGTIGEVSTVAILLGAIYLLIRKIISWEIPVMYLGFFVIFELIFGSQPGNISFAAAQLCSGGLMLGAFFMATDYVTSPITKKGKILYGALLGILTGILRTFGASAEGVSYAIILGNLLVPLIEKLTIPKAFGYENGALEGKKGFSLAAYRPAFTLCLITLLAGLALGGAYQLTKGPIEKANLASATEAYKGVMPTADSFQEDEDLAKAAEALTAEDGTVADGAYGNIVYESTYQALDQEGSVVGYVVNVTSKDGFGGDITISVGIDASKAVTGIEFLTINETAGLGMRAQEEDFRDQFVTDKAVEKFELVKDTATEHDEIQALSGATITSTAVTNAVNAALALVNSASK